MDDNTTRYENIDFLKTIGLSGIILAHMDAPPRIAMIRSFDVPFLIFLSAILVRLSYERAKKNGKSDVRFCVDRVKRLVFPTWIFLLFYFLLRIIILNEIKTIDYYMYSFILTRYGVGYVWIILIYIYSTLLVVLLDKSKAVFRISILIFAIYILYEVGLWHEHEISNKFVETTFCYMVPYGVVTFFGYNFRDYTTKRKIIYTILSFSIFIGLALWYRSLDGSFVSTEQFKWPPRMYYLSYGIGCSFALTIISEKLSLKIYKCSFVKYVSNHTLWIYFWHVVVLNVCQFFAVTSNWLLRYIIVCTLSVLIVLVLNAMLDLIQKKGINWPFLNYLRG